MPTNAICEENWQGELPYANKQLINSVPLMIMPTDIFVHGSDINWRGNHSFDVDKVGLMARYEGISHKPFQTAVISEDAGLNLAADGNRRPTVGQRTIIVAVCPLCVENVECLEGDF